MYRSKENYYILAVQIAEVVVAQRSVAMTPLALRALILLFQTLMIQRGEQLLLELNIVEQVSYLREKEKLLPQLEDRKLSFQMFKRLGVEVSSILKGNIQIVSKKSNKLNRF
jgi:hypothetical protein